MTQDLWILLITETIPHRLKVFTHRVPFLVSFTGGVARTRVSAWLGRFVAIAAPSLGRCIIMLLSRRAAVYPLKCQKIVGIV